MSAKRFTDEQAQEIGEKYLTGISLRSLASEYDCPPTSIRNTIRRIGIETRGASAPKFWTPQRLRYIAGEYERGRTQEEIAKELDVDQTAISRRLRQQGIRRGQARKLPKGGRSVTQAGYVYVLVSSDDLPLCVPNSTGYVLEHRLVMGKSLGRPLRSDETVHHINGDRQDNRIDNLQLRQGLHGKGVIMQCNSCGSHDIASTAIS